MIKQCRKLNLTFKISWIKQVGSMHFLNHLQDLFDTLPKHKQIYAYILSVRAGTTHPTKCFCDLRVTILRYRHLFL